MRRLAVILVLVFSALGLRAAEPFFCVDAGARLDYVRTSSSGKVKWTHIMTIKDVQRSLDGGMFISFSSLFLRPDTSQMYGGEIDMHSTVMAGGDVMMDISSTMESVFENVFSSSSVVSEGGTTILPSNMIPGDTLPDARSVVKVFGVRYTTDVTQRRVLRFEQLRTPAGTYDCIVVSEHKVEHGPGRNRVTTGHTWYARGIGMVRHDTYDKKGRLDTSEVLVSVLK